MIIDRESIRSLGLDSHGTDMTIQWDNAAILLHNIDSTKNNVFALSQHNAPFNSERKIMKRILDAKYSNADIKSSQKAPLIFIFKKEMSYTYY